MHVNASTDEIAAFLDRILDAPRFEAAEPDSNRLLYRHGPGVSKFAVAVNTSLTTIVGAAKAGAQLLVVHHPSWEAIDLYQHGEKMQALEQAGISLYAAHASLDCAPEFGNSCVLARIVGVEAERTFYHYHGGDAGVIGRTTGDFSDFVQRCSRALGVEVEAHRNSGALERVAIVAGAGGDTAAMEEARSLGADTFLTGEGSMFTRMFAKEAGMNLLFATHHATEAPGIKSLGERIAAETGLPFEFVPDASGVF